MADEQSQPSLANGYRLWLPWFGALWAGVLWFTTLQPRAGLYIAIPLFLIIPSLTWFARHDRARWLLPVTCLFFLISSFAALSVTSFEFWQWIIIATGGVMLAFLLHHRRDLHDRLSGRELNVIVALIIFFSWLVLLSFGNGIFLVWPWWWLAIGGGVLLAISSIILWSDNGLRWSQFVGILPLVAVTGAALMVVTWWLPTVVTVGAIVATTAAVLWLQSLQHVWRGTWEAGRGRRYILVSLTIIISVLVTARWTN